MALPEDMPVFDEAAFRAKVNTAIGKVKTLIDNTRNPQLPTEVQHQWDDKYKLVEFLVNTSIEATWQALESIGVTTEIFAKFKSWSKERNVTLQFQAIEDCKFLRKVVREVESDTKHVSKSTLFGKSESFTVTKVTEYFWLLDAKWNLRAFVGTDEGNPIIITSRSGNIELKTSTEPTPRPQHMQWPSAGANITWLLANTNDKRQAIFAIDRADKRTRTPLNNDTVSRAVAFISDVANFCKKVSEYYRGQIFTIENPGTVNSIQNETVLFVPIVPIFDRQQQEERVLPATLSATLLAEQKRTIGERFVDFDKVSGTKLISPAEAKLFGIVSHVRAIWTDAWLSIRYIQDMIYKQLISAIGKELTPVDFTNYQRFHNRKLFTSEYQPRAFSYAIRRPDHPPEGMLVIEGQLADGSLPDPIYTSVCPARAVHPMKFALDASTNVSFYGNRYLHGWIQHQFEEDTGLSLSLVARARQFSSFIVLLGAIASADTFEPKYAILLQNKDELKIPLNLETIPTPKEFRDAIESLSPEQQRFAKAYRSMQLSATLFAVCVIQVKPQLEKLLNLDDDSLTKEINLTQDLMKLFIEYQIPSDMLSYEGDQNRPASFKVEQVKKHVQRMLALVARKQDKEVAEAKAAEALALTSGTPLEIQIKTLTGKTVPIPWPGPNAKMQVIMSALEDKEGIPVSQQRLVFAGTALRPEMTLKEKKIGPGATLHLVLRLRGDGGGDSRAALHEEASCGDSTGFAGVTTGELMPVANESVQEQGEVLLEPPEPKSADANKQQQDTTKDKKTDKTVSQASAGAVDYTRIPFELERKFDELDEDGSLRPTIITAGNTWQKRSQPSLLAKQNTKTVDVAEQGKERTKAYDVLDALTKSGALSIDQAELHVIVASTHSFGHSLMKTVCEDNINPIEKVERSSLIVASTIQHKPPVELIVQEQRERVLLYSPKLLQ